MKTATEQAVGQLLAHTLRVAARKIEQRPDMDPVRYLRAFADELDGIK